MIQGLLYPQTSTLFVCVIRYKPCIIFALHICSCNLLRCWDGHSGADKQSIFLCIKPVAMCVFCQETPSWFSQAPREMHVSEYCFLSVHQGTTCTDTLLFPPMTIWKPRALTPSELV